MLVTVLIWVAVVASVLGYATLYSGRRNCRIENLPVEIILGDVYGGLLCVAALLLAVSLWWPLTWWVGLATIAPGLFVVLLSGASRFAVQSRIANSKWLFVMFPAALFLATREVSFYDTALYHQQAVNWLSSFGLVRGLALLHFRLGFTSSWFALAAPINSGELAGRTAGIVGGLLPGVMVVAVAAMIFRWVFFHSCGLRTLSWGLFCAGLLVVAFVWDVEASLSPDVVVWLLPIVVATTMTDDTASRADRVGKATFLATLGCLAKLTALPLLFYALGFSTLALVRGGNRIKVGAWLGASAIAAILLVYANMKVSGCPIFPSSIGCTSSGWSVDGSVARQIEKGIAVYARSHNRVMNEVWPLVAAAGTATIVALLTQRSNIFVRHALAMSWVGIIAVLFEAPNPRFGVGYFMLPLAIGVASLANRGFFRRLTPLSARALPYVRVHAFSIGVLLLILACAVSASQMTKLTDLVYPRRMASADGDPIYLRNQRVSRHGNFSLARESRPGFEVARPLLSDQCWNAALPCSPRLTVESIELRDPHRGLSAGFVRR